MAQQTSNFLCSKQSLKEHMVKKCHVSLLVKPFLEKRCWLSAQSVASALPLAELNKLKQIMNSE